MNLYGLFPNASKAFLNANSRASGSKPEQAFCDESVATNEGETKYPKRRLIRYTSYRCRLLDEDNGCTKYFTDALRYCGIIADDAPDQLEIQVRQEKVRHKADEKTVIELQ